MQTAQWKPELAVADSLPSEPQRYEFVQLVRTLLRWLHRQGVSNDEALAGVLRFRNSVLLSFPPSEVESVRAEALDAAAAGAFARLARGHAPAHIIVTPAFMGLLGLCGVLPYHYTERIGAQQSRDDGARALFDLFANRLLALYFQAWGKYRVEHQLDMQGQDGFLPLLAAIGGALPQAGSASDADDASGSDIVGRYAALYRTRPVAGEPLGRALADHLRVPVTIEQFAGAWSGVAKNRQSRLGTRNCTLGYGAMLGKRQWRTDLRLRIHIGPIEKKDFQRFLPTGSGRQALLRLVRLFGASALQYEVNVHLHKCCVAPVVLTSQPDQQARQYLGWNSFLSDPHAKEETRTIRYMLEL